MQPPRLIFADLISDAFRVVTGHPRALLDLALVPTVISVALSMAGRLLSGDRLELFEAMIVRLADFVPTAMFAVAWYRLVLLGPQAVVGTPGLGWTPRERGYLGQFLAIAAIPIVLYALFAMLMPWPMQMPAPGAPLPPGVEAAMPLGLAFTITAIIALRLSYGLVAPSVDLTWSPNLSWRYGKGNGATILFSMLLMMVIGMVVKVLITMVLLAIAVSLFGTFDASGTRQPLSIGPWLLVTLAVETVAYVAIAPLITVQALIFRAVTGFAPGGPLRQPPP
ncbi:MAG TPA: hypothetical protein VJ890_24005 [Vineibacter sp.]|nr:hypothetical protein [Vineibacter sp.]